MKKAPTQLFILIFALLTAQTVFAAKDLPTFSLNKDYIFIDDASIPSFIDRNKTYSETQILGIDPNKWNYNPAQFNYPKDLDANIWFRFRTNQNTYQKAYVIHLYNGMIPLFKVYQRKNDQLVLIDSLGSIFPHALRANHYRDAVIALPYEKEVQEYYLMVNAKYYHGFDIALRSYENLFNYALNEYYLLGAFYGILILVLLYNLFYFIQIRDKLYLIYALYVFIALLSSSSNDLIGYWKFWPNAPYLSLFFVNQTKWLISASFVLYAVYFLRLKKINGFWHKAVVASASVYIIYNALLINQIVDARIYLFLAVLIIHLTILWVAAWKSWRAGNRSSGIFIVGLSTMVAAFIGQYLRYWELIPVTVGTHFIMHYGILAEVVVLTYAMSDKFKQERKSKIAALEAQQIADKKLIKQLKLNEELKDKVNNELEQKVKEKVADLEIANAKLQEQSKSIQVMNDELAKLNGALYIDKKRQQQARAYRKNMSKEEFFEIFPTKIECIHLLNDLKSITPFACLKCGHTQSTPGTGLLSKRCTRCGYNEPVTARTLFKGFRSPLPNGFYLVYLLVESRFTLSATELSKATDLGLKSAWKLHKDLSQNLGKDHSNNWLDYLIN